MNSFFVNLTSEHGDINIMYNTDEHYNNYLFFMNVVEPAMIVHIHRATVPFLKQYIDDEEDIKLKFNLEQFKILADTDAKILKLMMNINEIKRMENEGKLKTRTVNGEEGEGYIELSNEPITLSKFRKFFGSDIDIKYNLTTYSIVCINQAAYEKFKDISYLPLPKFNNYSVNFEWSKCNLDEIMVIHNIEDIQLANIYDALLMLNDYFRKNVFTSFKSFMFYFENLYNIDLINLLIFLIYSDDYALLVQNIINNYTLTENTFLNMVDINKSSNVYFQNIVNNKLNYILEYDKRYENVPNEIIEEFKLIRSVLDSNEELIKYIYTVSDIIVNKFKLYMESEK